jgi:hypothetical protein
MALDSVLTTLAEGFRIDLGSSGAADRQFTAQLLPPPGSVDDKGDLNVTDLVTSTQVTPSPVDVSWRTQDVRFADTDIANAPVLGGLPINDLLALNVGSVTNGATSPPGVPGLLGILTGTIPLPIEVTALKTFTVTLVDVRWRVRDANGQAVAGVSWSLGGAPPVSGTGGDIAPPIGRALDLLTLVFDLVFAEQTSSFQPLIQRRLEASVRLQAGGVSTGWIDLPPVDLQLPVIPVPTIAVFCQDTNFGSNKLVVVPGNSLFDEDTVQAALTALRDTLDPLRSAFSFLGVFLDAAGTVADLLSGGNVTFRKADEISNLNDIDLESGFFNDTEAEDELSSLILVGPPHRRIEGFNDRSFSTSQGQINVTVGTELIVQVASLHSASPASIPPGRVGVPFPPDGSRFLFHDITTFGDELSSLRFAWES